MTNGDRKPMITDWAKKPLVEPKTKEEDTGNGKKER